MNSFPNIKVEVSGNNEQSNDNLNSCGGSEPFALQVLGNGMEPEFPDKCIILVAPSNMCHSGAFVVATVEGERWFRRYVKDETGERLVALNTDYLDIQLSGNNWTIEGVIVQRNIRRQIKHYSIQ